MNKLALGTVQFGLDYGIANKQGMINRKEAHSILTAAKNSNISYIDTAINYGSSEEVLGDYGVESFRVISKLPKLPIGQVKISKWIEFQVEESLKKLNIDSLYGLLLHSPQDLQLYEKELLVSLRSMKEGSSITKIGVSIYDPNELDTIFNIFKPDIVQVPLNIFDTRIINSGWLDRLVTEEVEIHSRSCFLQGLLLMDDKERPQKFDRWSKHFTILQTWLSDLNISPLEACLSFALNEKRINKVIVGVDSYDHFLQIISIKSKILDDIPSFKFLDDRILSPFLWTDL